MKCSGKTYDNWHYYPCQRRAIVERDSKWFCPSHDPVAIEERRREAEAKRKSKECQQCGWDLQSYWAYCPHCGTKKGGI